MHPLTLRFADKQQEDEFCRLQNEIAHKQYRLAGALALGLWLGYGYLEYLLVDTGLSALYIVRYVVEVPIFAVCLALAWVPATVRIIQPLICSLIIVAAAGLDVGFFLAPLPSDWLRSGTTIALLFLYAFVSVRFIWAIPTTIVVLIFFEATMWTRTEYKDASYNTFILLTFVVIGSFVSYTLEHYRRLEFLREIDLATERARSDALLHNILPLEIASRLRTNPEAIAQESAGVSVLFADIVGFTPWSQNLTPTEVVANLNRLFACFDDCCRRRGIEKIKTIGDAYMAVAGLPVPNPDHARDIIELAKEFQEMAAEFAADWPGELALRVGISSGPVVAGVIGRHKFAYDLWGDTVNTASRMESHGVPGRIHVSEATYELLEDRYEFSERRRIDIKGKGTMTTYLLAEKR